MKYEYKVNVKEILSRTITVEAEDAFEAEEKVADMVRNSEIILDADDFIDREITIISRCN